MTQSLQPPKGLLVKKFNSTAKKEVSRLKEKHFRGGDNACGWEHSWVGEAASVSARKRGG